VGSIATAALAGMAPRSWREQMRGTSRHLAAAQIAEAAQLTRYYFYDARNGLIHASEFPSAYNQNSQPSRKKLIEPFI
jgi:Tfp pilus assembly protein PilE